MTYWHRVVWRKPKWLHPPDAKTTCTWWTTTRFPTAARHNALVVGFWP